MPSFVHLTVGKGKHKTGGDAAIVLLVKDLDLARASLDGLELVLVKRRAGSILVLEDIALEPPRKNRTKLVFGVCARGNAEDLVQLLETLLLGLGHEAVDESQRHQVHGGVESESTSRGHGAEHAGEGQAEDGTPEVVCGDGPGHADFSVGEREDFGRVHEGDGTLTWNGY